MGQYFNIVNVTKKQYIDIAQLGENSKFSFIGQGLHGIALGRLLTSLGEKPEGWEKYFGDPDKDRFFVGAWASDKVIIAGDYDLPNTNGVETSIYEDPKHNLYHLAETDSSYENVTGEIIYWLAKQELTADMLAERGKHDIELLKVLSELVFVRRVNQMKESLEKVVGADWAKLLKEK